MSYTEIESRIKEQGMECPCMGTDSDLNPIIISAGCDEEGRYYEIQTSQPNNWLRINRYYESGVTTETFDK